MREITGNSVIAALHHHLATLTSDSNSSPEEVEILKILLNPHKRSEIQDCDKSDYLE